MSRIDLLQVDAEGYDANVISQMLAAGFYPGAIHYESLHLSRLDMAKCRRLLGGNGYVLVGSTVNTLAWKKT